ncbi:RNA polymerase-associated protein rtf1 [Collariella sp. IMI 366227]|nr:RNA polymerase-associated protein rtf1 [Collariella sp. IMI 366227]
MSDIDDELLALAGGDVSSDEEDAAMDMSREESRSPSPAPPSSKETETPARGVAVKKTGASAARRRSSRTDDESEDEGEASSPPGSPDSQMSAPMDESDSDDDAPQNRAADDDLQYPVEGLFRSHEEKARIMGMREIEREQILAERREENERIRQNRMLRQLKVNQEKDSKKRKASAADLDDPSRKPARARTKAGESSDKMDTLRRAREERSSRKEQRERENDRRRQRSPSYRRSHSISDRSSDGGWRRESRQKSRTPEPKEALPADLHDVERLRVGRSRFAEVCFYPGFEKAITGCYVRVNIGPDPETRQEIYRMAVIKGFTQGRPYAIPDHSGHPMVVDLYVKAAHGKAQREWPFIACSDRNFTEAEWNRYQKVSLGEGLTLPTKPDLISKIDDINRLVKRTWTEQELSDKLKRQNALHIKYSGAERDSLTKQLDHAHLRGDTAAAARLQSKLDALEDTPRLAFRTSMVSASKLKAASKGPSQQEKLALLNAENRRKNAESGWWRKEMLPHIAKLQEQQRSAAAKGMPVIHKPLMDDDIIGALDLDIDVEID